jgi:hypothetical protein
MGKTGGEKISVFKYVTFIEKSWSVMAAFLESHTTTDLRKYAFIEPFD